MVVVMAQMQTRRWNVAINAVLLEVFSRFPDFQWCLWPSASRVVSLAIESRLVAWRDARDVR